MRRVAFFATEKRWWAAIGILAASFGSPGRAQTRPDTTTQLLAPDVTLTQEITRGAAPLVVSLIRADLRRSGVRVECGQSYDALTLRGPTLGRETVSAIAKRHHALAAINADFFPFTGDPLGLAIRNGELLSEPMDYRACVGFGPKGVVMDVLVVLGTLTLADKSVVPLDGINRVPESGDAIVLTPSYSATPSLKRPTVVVELSKVTMLPVRVSQTVQGVVRGVTTHTDRMPACPPDGVLIVASGAAGDALRTRCQPGDSVGFRFDLASQGAAPAQGRYPSHTAFARSPDFKPIWTDVTQAVGGGPWLVRDGKIAVDDTAEAMPKAGFVEARHPRSAIGITAEGSLLLVAVDGRSRFSRGATLAELAGILLRLGARNAINLDGGGSTTLVVGDAVINAPSDGAERPIADALLLYGPYDDKSAVFSTDVSGDMGIALDLIAGETRRFTLPPNGNAVLYGTDNGLGWIDQSGLFSSLAAGRTTIIARTHGAVILSQLRVLPAAPTALNATITALAPNKDRLRIMLRDKFGNGIPKQSVQLTIVGGNAPGTAMTDANGQATVDIAWTAEEALRNVKIVSGALQTVAARVQPVKPPASPDPDDKQPTR